MRPSSISSKAVRVSLPKPTPSAYTFPSLSSISVSDLPNNGFGINNYNITKTKYGHWPVYKKVQNTKITTEVKRLEGDLDQFKRDLLQLVPNLHSSHISVNKVAGYVNIKGDRTELIKEVLDEHIKN